MRRHVARVVLLAPLLLAGCGRCWRHAPEAGPQPRYVVGPAYQAGAVWFYPREDFHLDATGLAVVMQDQTGLTANGEARSPLAMAGAHATLQLPAVARVTNLETGLQVVVRINDRGPGSPGRLLGLTPRAADRLGMKPGTPARIRVQVEDGPSRALRDQLQDRPSVAVASAPREQVASEELAPPPGMQRSTRGRIAPMALATKGSTAPGDVAQANLPDTVIRVPVEAGQLWLRAGEFGEARYANQVTARLAGLTPATEHIRQGRFDAFRVRAGPFWDVRQADSALDQALKAGVTDAHIVVE